MITRFAEAINMPVAHTMSGKGSIACTSPLNAGIFGRYDRIANRLIDESDVLLVVGYYHSLAHSLQALEVELPEGVPDALTY